MSSATRVLCVALPLLAGPAFAEAQPAAPPAVGDDCEFKVQPEHGPAPESAAERLDAKLAEFDRCMASVSVVGSQAGGAGATGAAGGAATAGAQSGAGGANGSSGLGTGGEGGESADSQSAGALAAANAASQDGALASESAVRPGGGQSDDADAGRPEPGLAQTGPTIKGTGRAGAVSSEIVEDDVARLLREAAEKETDPQRKASLMKNYEDYMASQRKRR